ncbi:MAG: response regulator [Gallionellaceae bacterium]
MNDKVKILVVDNDSFVRELIEDVLSESYQLVMAEDGVDALMRVQLDPPALILLDVQMPGMDGYEICRRLKREDATKSIPVVFVSAHDQIEERLKGYEAGGSDYVTKPFDSQELKAKIAHLLGVIAERSQLKEMVGYATNTAMTAMTSMAEMGALLESMKKFNASRDEMGLAQAILYGLSLYGLDGIVQVRAQEKSLSLTKKGLASPLEISVIDHMIGMDRIVQFKSRMSIHYPHVALLVDNMPMEDQDLCGRLRDHLSMLLEAAEMRANGIVAENELRRHGEVVKQVIDEVSEVLNEVNPTMLRSRDGRTREFSIFLDNVEKALLKIAVNKKDDEILFEIVKSGIENITNIQFDESGLQNQDANIQKLLEGTQMKASGNESRRHGMDVKQIIEGITGALSEISPNQSQSKSRMNLEFAVMLDNLDKALPMISITKEEENFFFNFIKNGVSKIINTKAEETKLQNQLAGIIQNMNKISG